MTKFGTQLFVRTTDEPVIVLWQWRYITLARRPVMGQDGIRYQFGLFFNTELETLAEQTQRTLATVKVRNQMAEAEMQAEQLIEGPLSLPLAFKKGTN